MNLTAYSESEIWAFRLVRAIPLCRWLVVLIRALHARMAVSSAVRRVYGGYREDHFNLQNKQLRDKSVVIVRPKGYFLWIPYGIVMEGICCKGRIELRKFESLTFKVVSIDPLIIKYSYFATERGASYEQAGRVCFASVPKGKFVEANGEFVLPPTAGSKARKHNVQILFQWQRISSGDIRRITNDSSLTNIADIRRFIEGQR